VQIEFRADLLMSTSHSAQKKAGQPAYCEARLLCRLPAALPGTSEAKLLRNSNAVLPACCTCSLLRTYAAAQ
jgi:hypothetical protein